MVGIDKRKSQLLQIRCGKSIGETKALKWECRPREDDDVQSHLTIRQFIYIFFFVLLNY